jgi:hypothetical protein
VVHRGGGAGNPFFFWGGGGTSGPPLFEMHVRVKLGDLQIRSMQATAGGPMRRSISVRLVMGQKGTGLCRSTTGGAVSTGNKDKSRKCQAIEASHKNQHEVWDGWTDDGSGGSGSRSGSLGQLPFLGTWKPPTNFRRTTTPTPTLTPRGDVLDRWALLFSDLVPLRHRLSSRR